MQRMLGYIDADADADVIGTRPCVLGEKEMLEYAAEVAVDVAVIDLIQWN